MNNILKSKPELLAPAGNLTCALAAFDAGADAVYAGMKRFNARERTENFSNEDISKLIAYAHKNSRKVYIAFNTLVKESEIPDAARELAELDLLRPDAVIVQDIGILRMLRDYFPKLEIHASTQMGLHNSAGLSFAEKLGVKRVILERQTYLSEIEMMMRSKPGNIDLEVFIHGALCCCISGSCLLSSWLGGWSGNRGKCKQPCRRRHHAENGNGFFLSAQDLCTLDIIPQIVATGVSSLKIEGRLRRVDYVANVVSAYRMALDASGDIDLFRDVLPKAKELLAKTCGRKWSLGFYTKESARELVKYDAMGVSGQLCGKVTGLMPNGFRMEATRRLYLGDALRIQPRSGDEGPAICITKMTVDGIPAKRVLKGETCFIFSDKEVPRDGIVYKTGESFDDFEKRIESLPLMKTPIDLDIAVSRKEISIKAADLIWKKPLALEEAGKRPLTAESVENDFVTLQSGKFSFASIRARVSGNPFLPASLFKSLRHEFRDFLDANLDSASVEASSCRSLERLLKDYTELTVHENISHIHDVAIVPRGEKPRLPEGCLIARDIESEPSPHEELLLPFFINESELGKIRQTLKKYIASGGHVVRISSLHHLSLLNTFDDITIKTNMPLPVCNSMAVKELSSLGVNVVQAWLELEKTELELLICKSVLPVEIYRYGRPPLLSTRATLAVDGDMSDARGNVFKVRKNGILTQVYAAKTMSLPALKGASANLYDLRFVQMNEKDTATFNFEHVFS